MSARAKRLGKYLEKHYKWIIFLPPQKCSEDKIATAQIEEALVYALNENKKPKAKRVKKKDRKK